MYLLIYYNNLLYNYASCETRGVGTWCDPRRRAHGRGRFVPWHEPGSSCVVTSRHEHIELKYMLLG